MLGYADGVKGYRLFDEDSKKIVISGDVKFKEDTFSLKDMNAKTNQEKRGRSCSEADDEENSVSLDWEEEIRKERADPSRGRADPSRGGIDLSERKVSPSGGRAGPP